MISKVFRFIIPIVISSFAVAGLLSPVNQYAYATRLRAPNEGITLMGVYEPSVIQPVLDEFTLQTDVEITYEQNVNIYDDLLVCPSVSECPDVAIAPNPTLVRDLVAQNALVPLDSILPTFDTYYSTTWRTLCSFRDALYCTPFSAGSKSMVWYRTQAFDSISASIPNTWTSLLDLSDSFLSHGLTPFSIGAESGGATGWPLSDWFEHILLRVGGPDIHRRLVHHKIAWTDPVIVETMQRFSDIIGRDDYQYGGTSGTLSTNFLDAFTPVFETPYDASMHVQASWARGFIETNYLLTPLTDFNFFDFPEINPAYGESLMGTADFVILFNDRAETRSFVQYMASPGAGDIVAQNLGIVSPNSGVDLDSYPDEMSKKIAQQILNASDFVFDLDDQLPPDLQTYIWSAMMDFVAHQDQMMSILQGIEDRATELQGAPYNLFLPLSMR